MDKKGKQKLKIISQIVDTLKLHYYPTHEDISNQEKYNFFLSDLKDSKSIAQNEKNEDNSQRFIKRSFGNHFFNVMATSVSGFSVVLKNNDVSIAFKKIINESNPFIKVEFRSEYLARVGYIKAVKQVNDFIERYISKTVNIKVSEIHLATDLQDIDFNILDVYKFKTRSRKKVVHTAEQDESDNHSMYIYGRRFSGFVLGGGNYMLRVYDKSLEISQNRNKEYIKFNKWYQNPDYDDTKKVWRVEIQLRRAKLKTMLLDDVGILDGFERVLNAIPSLWFKAVNDFDFKELSENQVLSIVKGYKTLKNGKEKLLSKYAYAKIFQRAETDLNWQDLEKWNHFNASSITRDVYLPYSSKFYLSNGLKSFLSQVSKVYGDITPDTLWTAFKDCEDMEIQNKSVSVIESVLLKQLDHFNKVYYERENKGIDTPLNLILQNNIKTYIDEASSYLYFNPTLLGVSKLQRAYNDF